MRKDKIIRSEVQIIADSVSLNGNKGTIVYATSKAGVKLPVFAPYAAIIHSISKGDEPGELVGWFRCQRVTMQQSDTDF